MTRIDQPGILQTKATPFAQGKGPHGTTGDGVFLTLFDGITTTEGQKALITPSVELATTPNPHAMAIQGSTLNHPFRVGVDLTDQTPSKAQITDGALRDIAANIATFGKGDDVFPDVNASMTAHLVAQPQETAIVAAHETAETIAWPVDAPEAQNNFVHAQTEPKTPWPLVDRPATEHAPTIKTSPTQSHNTAPPPTALDEQPIISLELGLPARTAMPSEITASQTLEPHNAPLAETSKKAENFIPQPVAWQGPQAPVQSVSKALPIDQGEQVIASAVRPHSNPWPADRSFQQLPPLPNIPGESPTITATAPLPNLQIAQKTLDVVFEAPGERISLLPSNPNQTVSQAAFNQPDMAAFFPVKPVPTDIKLTQNTVIPDRPSGDSRITSTAPTVPAPAVPVGTATVIPNAKDTTQQAIPPIALPISETSPDTTNEPLAAPVKMASGSDIATVTTISKYQAAVFVQTTASASQTGPLKQANTPEPRSAPTLASQSRTFSDDRQNVPVTSLPAPSPMPDTKQPPFKIAQATPSDVAAYAPAQTMAATTPPAQPATAAPPHNLVPLTELPHHIRQHTALGKPTSLELSMAPEELGKLRLFMTPDGDKLRIVFQAERPETLELLRRNSDSFSADLRQAGFGNASFSFGGWGDPPPDQNAQPQNITGDAISSTPEQPNAQIRYSKPGITTGLDLRV